MSNRRDASFVNSLFQRKTRSRTNRRRDERQLHRSVERLEERRVMAFDLVSAFATASDSPFYVNGLSAATLNEAPQQITLRFSPGVKIDPTSLASISIVRSGGANDPFGNPSDVRIVPGSILVNDLPNQNEVVVRFADTLPDDTYRISIGGGAGGLKTTSGDTMAAARSFDVRLDLGAFVVSVVPQPITRTGGGLVQERNQVVVYFNAADPLNVASAQATGSYRLFEVDRTTGLDKAAGGVPTFSNPTSVAYDRAAGKAVLTFAPGIIADGRLFRLQVGAASTLGPTPAARVEGVDFQDANSSFSTAVDLGALPAGGATVNAAIDRRATVPTPFSGEAGDLRFPSQPGSLDEPGRRSVPNYAGNTDGLPKQRLAAAQSIPVKFYNFKDFYGTDPQGNPLSNAITETQKQRAREVFELLSHYHGIRFIETPSDGLTVATGDVRAADPNVPPTGPGGIGGGDLAIINSLRDWGASEYGGLWFQVAMHEIGHCLGLGHSYQVPSVMGAGLTGEPIFPGDYDRNHFSQYFPATGSDIDVFKFTLPTDGRLTAETVVARPGQPLANQLDGQLDSLITLYRVNPTTGVRELVARNDDYYGRDSFVGLDLSAGTYFVAVTSTGNDAFNPEALDSGYGGRTDGAYELKLGFRPASTGATTILDESGTQLDGDRDGEPGGAFSFWFNTASQANTVFVDKIAPNGGNGSINAAYNSIETALANIGARTLIRIVGNTANRPYVIGTDLAFRPIAGGDGSTFNVPAGVTVMIDEGAIFKLRAANIDVGSSSALVSRAGASLQVLGTPAGKVTFTSWHDDTVGGNSDGVGPAVSGGQWGGIVFRGDSDFAASSGGAKTAFVNSISQANLNYGGGQVSVDSRLDAFAPIQLEDTRPTLAFNTITNSAGAGISATPDSFEDSNGRVGPEIRGNRLLANSTNGLFVKIDTPLGGEPDRLDVPARFRSTDIVYVLQDNLFIAGGAGGDVFDPNTAQIFARKSGRLTIDPGVIVKLQGARIELERGGSQLIAEGTAGQRVVFTSLGDNRFGAGGTFDTNGNLADVRQAGDWGGIVLNAGSKASIDYSYLAFGGGLTPIEGTLDRFNVVEVHQGDLRLAHSRIESNASGAASTNRTGRGGNAAATIFVRGAQPVILGNDFRDNLGAVVSVDANSLSDLERPDPGRSTGGIERDARYDDNRGPLVRDNRLSPPAGGQAIAGMLVRGAEISTETVWDDTDIVHVLQDEIIVSNFQTATGVRLVSQPTASLVVKLAGSNAGFTATGYGTDSMDRIGGTVQVVGHPGYPVIMTSLKDDSVGASLDPLGRLQTDTNADGAASSAAAGDWRSLRFLPFSNDTNVAIVQETEKAAAGWQDSNGTASTAQVLGVLAPNRNSGDENRRLGYEVHGVVSWAAPGDVDVYSFAGYGGSEVWIDIDKTSPGLDAMVELLDAAGNVLARSADGQTDAALQAARGLGQHLGKESSAGGDFYSVNPKDPGMRVILPGTPGTQNQYFVRVRSQPRYDATTTADTYRADLADPNKTGQGATSGAYELRVRLQQRDEKPGSTVRHADIRFPQTGIDVMGLPRNSLLTGETGETTAANDVFANAQFVGNVLQSDKATISIAGEITSAADVDWYQFALNFEQLQAIANINAANKSWSTVFDIDYGDGFRGDLTLSVFDASGRLIYVGRDSNVGPDQGGNAFTNLSAGSAGVLDPFIGSVQLATGSPTGSGGTESGGAPTPADPARQLKYYVAVSSNERLPAALDATFKNSATNALVRLEPVNSIRRIVEDHIGFQGYTSGESGTPFTQKVDPVTGPLIDTSTAINLSANVTPFTLADVTLFVSAANTLRTVDAMRGGVETILSGTGTDDLVMRSDGRLYGYRGLAATANTAGTLDLIDSGTGGRTNIGNDSIPDAPAVVPVPATENNLATTTTGVVVSATAFTLASRNVTAGSVNGVLRLQYTDNTSVPAVNYNGSWAFSFNAGGGFVLGAADPTNTAGIAQPKALGSTLNRTTGAMTIAWTGNIPPAAAAIQTVSYTYDPDPNAVTTNTVDALAWNFTTATPAANALYYSVRDGGKSRLYRANPSNGSAAVVTGQPWGRIGGVGGYIQTTGNTLGITTGMAFLGGTLYGVDDNGNFFTISTGNAAATLVTAVAGAPSFAGLTVGPKNLQGGAFADKLFAIDDGGMLYCLDTSGNLLEVFDPDKDGLVNAGVTSVDTGVSGATGLAFSPLDINLWHPTTYRGGESGHGINAARDNSRDGGESQSIDDGLGNSRSHKESEGGVSMYFGFERHVASGVTPYLNYQAGQGQYGVETNAWQQDLSSNDEIPNTYNLPGGAYGSMTTGSFSLAAYSYADKPTLYFNYWLETQNASGSLASTTMRDSARVFASTDGGVTWELLATNNSTKSTADTTSAELPAFSSASAKISNNTNQQVQELFDSASWRQARVDLGNYARKADIRLRFDFSTAGMFDPTQKDAAGNDVNAGGIENGDFSSPTRGQNNQFGGFAIDDIIVGFAERGEMVTGAQADQTAFYAVGTPLNGTATVPAQSLSGPYQLEIRHGTNYASQENPNKSFVKIFQTFDTDLALVPTTPVLDSTFAGGFPATGDANTLRQQGQFLIQNNLITSAATYGISIDAGVRDPNTNAPVPGVTRNLPVLNNSRLVPGVVVANNVLSTNGTGGILFSGDPNTGTVPTAAVPYGRIVNNTIYGGPTSRGTGVTVTENAGPTLMNNLFANLATGVSVDASSRVDAAGNQRTVITTSAFYAVGTQVAGGATQSQPLVLADDPFVKASTGNFYPAAGSRAIDSALNSLADRNEFFVVNVPIGVPQSPIVAPDRDLFGQLRNDDPAQASVPGLGSNVFKDRGAIDRVDFAKPFLSLAAPLDNVAPDDDATPDVVLLKREKARGLTQFTLQLTDNGAGIDRATVKKDAFTFTRDGVALVEGTDYVFRYLETTNQVVLESAAVFSTGVYVIRVNQATVGGVPTNMISDLAGNPLLPNKTDGTASFQITLAEVPGIPTGVTGAAGDAAAVVSWAPPANGSIATIIDYTIQYSADGGTTWTTFPHPASAATSITVTGLANNTPYVFRVAAVNAVGQGEFSSLSSPVTPMALPPNQPTGLTAVAGDRQAVISWGAAADNGAAITDYDVQFSVDGGGNWSAFADGVSAAVTATVTGLTNGVSYVFRVRALNKNGFGTFSAASSAVTPNAPASAPTITTATAGDGSVTLGWSTPTSNGGLPISGYSLEYTSTAGTTALSVGLVNSTVITGLANGTAYTFRVRAITGVGNGALSSPSTAVTPRALPGVPTGVMAVASGVSSASVVWTAPANTGGLPISGYVIRYTGAGQTATLVVNGASTLATVANLSRGVPYTFTVAAVTAAGTGAFSAPSNAATPAPQPKAPSRPSATLVNGVVNLRWTAPGRGVSDYIVQASSDGGSTWTIVADGVSSATRASLAGLENGRPYIFRVAAIVNGVLSGFSTVTNRVMPFDRNAKPAAPANLAVTSAGMGTFNLRWDAVAGNAGGPVTGYVIQYRVGTSPKWTTVNASAATSRTLSRLTNRAGYVFRVAARNTAGVGSYSAEATVS